MTVNNLKELSKLIDLCRKKGVDSIAVDGINLKLGDAPQARNVATTEAKDDSIKTEPAYDEEDLLFWSSTQHG